MTLHSDDIFVSPVEPVVAYAERNENITQRTRIDEEVPEIDPLRERAAAEDRPAAVNVPLYVSEKFSVERFPDGRFRLTPHAHVMAAVKDNVLRGLKAMDKYAPKGSDEAAKAADGFAAVGSLLEYILDEDTGDGAAKPKAETAFINLAATYWYQYAITRFEASEWAARDASRGNDPRTLSERDNRFAAKGERMRRYARLASIWTMSLPTKLAADQMAIATAAANQLYNAASWQAKQLQAQQTAPSAPPAGAEAKAAVSLAVDLLDAA